MVTIEIRDKGIKTFALAINVSQERHIACPAMEYYASQTGHFELISDSLIYCRMANEAKTQGFHKHCSQLSNSKGFICLLK